MRRITITAKTAIIAFALTLGTAFTAFAGNVQGHLDSVSDSCITGWALDTEQSEYKVSVDITVTNRVTLQTAQELHATADTTHSGLTTLNNGSGSHGFSAGIDWSSLPNGVYTIQASSNGQPLSNSLLYTNTSGTESAAAEGASLTSLGTFKTTAYCPCFSCSEGWGRKTCTGALATAGHTVAVDPRVIPFGSKLLIDGIVYTAEDRGGAVKGNHIDIYYNTHSETRMHGTRQSQVFLIQ